jgi:hypothetical protein
LAIRIRKDGRILCAARYLEEDGDCYLDDGIHYLLSVEHKVLVTEPMKSSEGHGGHSKHGEWWWKGQEPKTANIHSFYYEK